MLCYFDRECRPFDGWLFGNGTVIKQSNVSLPFNDVNNETEDAGNITDTIIEVKDNL